MWFILGLIVGVAGYHYLPQIKAWIDARRE